MNPHHDLDLNQSLDRLLRNAANAKRPAEAPLPFVIEARTLAAWRARGTSGSEFAAGLRLLRYGLGGACAVALVTVSLSWRGTQSDTDDLYAISNATANVAMLR